MTNCAPLNSTYSSIPTIKSPTQNNLEPNQTVYQPALDIIALSNPFKPLERPEAWQQASYANQHPLVEILAKKGIFNVISTDVHLPKTCVALSVPTDFKAEFNQLQLDTFYLRDPSLTLIGKQYEAQNRYSDTLSTDEWLFRPHDPQGILPFEGWKKQLMEWDGLGECPYINASRIESHSGDIITQAPLSKTEDDFWKMAWVAQASIVLMLTPLYEDGKRKSSHYFPETPEHPFLFGEHFKIKVSLIQELYRNGFVNKELIMKHAGEERTLSIIHCSDWTDKQAYPIDRLLWLVIYTAGLAKGKTLIAHCCAGIGRSGTFYACYLIFLCWKQNNDSIQVDVPRLIKFLRNFRAGLIQTAVQYAIIFDFINALNTYKG